MGSFPCHLSTPNKEQTFLGLLFGLGFWAVAADLVSGRPRIGGVLEAAPSGDVRVEEIFYGRGCRLRAATGGVRGVGNWSLRMPPGH
jgi:hypothetical protein